MDQVTIDCIKSSLSEIFMVGAVTAIIAFLRGKGIEALGQAGFRLLLKRLAAGFLKKGATRFIPWLGLALLLYDIFSLLRHCF